jgi:hypothetical protein
MKYTTIAILLLPALLCAQEFQFRQEFDTIPVEINGWQTFAPWEGGFSESAPDFVDIDSDGDLDILVGQFVNSPIPYFENVGNITVPDYALMGLSDSLKSVDEFGHTNPDCFDLDADGDWDILIGGGYVTFVENIGTASSPNYLSPRDTLFDNQGDPVFGTHVALVDIDDDGDADLVGGEYQGHLQFYRNVGTAFSFAYNLESNPWLGINVGDDADPTFCDIDSDGDFDLFIGNSDGNIWYYRNDGDSVNYNFSFVTNFYDSIEVDWYAAPEFADIDGDGDYDLIVGRDNQSTIYSPGDLFFYENIGSVFIPQWILRTKNYLGLDEGNWAANCMTDIDADIDADLFAQNMGDRISYFENIGDSMNASFSWITGSYQNISVNDGNPAFADMDDDQDPDLFVGEALLPNPPYPGLYLYRNTGTPQNATFALYSNNLVPYPYHVAIRPLLADIDADGDRDLFLRDNNDVFYFVENIGSPAAPQFADPVLNWQGLSTPGGAWSTFYDIDGDGDLDYFRTMGNWVNDDFIGFYLNTGSPQMPNLVFQTNTFLQLEGGKFVLDGIDIVDIDHDGDGDFFLGTAFSGGMMFFRNITGDTSAVGPPPVQRHPQAGLQILLGPNPANPNTVISFSLPFAQQIDLAVYNLLGARVTTLASGLKLPGSYVIPWDASRNASGVYIIRLETPVESLSEKLTIIK